VFSSANLKTSGLAASQSSSGGHLMIDKYVIRGINILEKFLNSLTFPQKTSRQGVESQIAQETYFSEEKDARKEKNAAIGKTSICCRCASRAITSFLKARAVHKSAGYATIDESFDF
jgi:hypothetical protein